MPDRKSYSIGWICALPIERAAAIGMLDVIHPPVTQLANDQNNYTLGRMGDHNVVIACLPTKTTGIGPAAAVGAQMLTAFPSLLFLLMVGVGGGVPSAGEDIRLGDVVVSVPTETYPGVIQYDAGKLLQNGQFQRTGSLSRPPESVLTAIGNLQAKHVLEPPCLSRYVKEFVEKYPHLEIQVKNHGPDRDLLFKANYLHQDVNASTCDICEQDQIVPRSARLSPEPVIHYGLIASGNTLMRDSLKRDELAAQYGILCFEMEAAGLVNTFPCLVVRGICDYSDSHKNKFWQPYAAVTAASFVKELLSIIPGSEISETPAEMTKMHTIQFSRNFKFTGREAQLEQLKTKLFGEKAVSRISMFGLGGVGKTQIALEFAHRLLDEKPDYPVFWVNGTSVAALEQSFAQIATLLPNFERGQSTTDIKSVVFEHLGRLNCKKWLMIIDNADDSSVWFEDQAIGNTGKEGALNKYLPTDPQASFLFTTRDLKTARRLAPSNTLEIQEMTNDTSEQLFRSLLSNPDAVDDEDSLRALISRLCGLPLALAQAAAFIVAENATVSTYLSFIDNTENDFVSMLSENFEEHGRYHEARNAVAATWLISFERIKSHDPLAADYLSLMACLEPEKIPELLVEPEGQKIASVKAFGTLMAYSFISRTDNKTAVTIYGRYFFDMHRLEWRAIALSRLASQLPGHDDVNPSWRTFLPHVDRVLSETNPTEQLAKRCILMEKVGKCLYMDEKYNRAEKMFSEAVEILEHIFGSEYEYTLYYKANLASTYRHLGQLNKAESLLAQVVEISKRVMGVNHRETLIQMSNLAPIYLDQGRVAESEALITQVMNMQKELFGESHQDTLSTLDNITEIHSYQGRWSEAAKLRERTLQERKQVFGERHPYTLQSMANLADIYVKQGHGNRARVLLEQVVRELNEVLGEEHPSTLRATEGLASAYKQQGAFSQAEAVILPVVETSKSVLGEAHPDTLTSLDTLVSIYMGQRKLNEAEALGLYVAETRKIVLGEENRKTLLSLSNLASVLAYQERLDDAEAIEKQIVKVISRVLGEEHPETLDSMSNLALTHKHQGRFREAETLMLKVLEAQNRNLGELKPNAIITLTNLASLYLAQNETSKAETLALEALAVSQQMHGEEHPVTLTATYHLAGIYLKQNRLQEAETLLEKVTKTRAKVLGEEHPDTLYSLGTLAEAFRAQKRSAEAEELQLRVIEGQKRSLGEAHPDTLKSTTLLAIPYAEEERLDESVKLHSKVIETSKRHFGANHFLTRWNMQRLALTYTKQGRFSEAECMQTELLEQQRKALGETHPATLRVMMTLAGIYEKQVRLNQAIDLYLRVTEARQEVLGKSHPDTLSGMDALKRIYEEQERWEEVEKLEAEIKALQ